MVVRGGTWSRTNRRTAGNVVHARDHAGFLLVVSATNAPVDYTLGTVALDAPRAGLAGGLLADVDLLVPTAGGPPLAHRGLAHTVLAAGLAVALAVAAVAARPAPSPSA